VRLRERVLELLKQYPKGLRQIDIARALGASRSRVSEIIKELERAGLVTRFREGSLQLIRLSNITKYKASKKVLKLGIVWSSEYPFITPFTKLLKRDADIDLDVIVYENGLDATWDLVLGRIDLVLSPLATQILYYALTNRLIIIGSGAAGGAEIFENEKCSCRTIASTRASTMDMCTARAIREGLIEIDDVIYENSGERIFRDLIMNRTRYAALWEPLARRARILGMKSIISCYDLDVNYCCTLAAYSGLDYKTIEVITYLYNAAIKEFLRNPFKWIDWYSAKVGIDRDLIKRSIDAYIYKEYIDVKEAKRTLELSGLTFPNPSIIKEAINV